MRFRHMRKALLREEVVIYQLGQSGASVRIRFKTADISDGISGCIL